MKKFPLEEIALALAVFLVVLALGAVLIPALPLGYTESSLLYLSAVIAASACWIGRKR